MSVTQIKSVKLAEHTWTIKDWRVKLGDEEKESNAIYSSIFELKENNGCVSKWRLKAVPTYKEEWELIKVGDKFDTYPLNIAEKTSKPALKISLELVDGKIPSGGAKFKFKLKTRLDCGCFGWTYTVLRSYDCRLADKITLMSLTSEEFLSRDLIIKISIEETISV